VKLRSASFFVVNWVSSCFDPLFPFSCAPPLLLHIFSLYPHTSTTTIIILEPCALSAEFQHFIPRFSKFPYCAVLTQRGDGRWKEEAQREGEDRVTLRKTLVTQLWSNMRLA
jgi:hypothetical protein